MQKKHKKKPDSEGKAKRRARRALEIGNTHNPGNLPVTRRAKFEAARLKIMDLKRKCNGRHLRYTQCKSEIRGLVRSLNVNKPSREVFKKYTVKEVLGI